MIIYKLNTDFVPKIEFAFSCTSDRFDNTIDCREDLIEIIFNTGPTLYGSSEIGDFEIPHGSLFFIMPDVSIQIRCKEGEMLSTQNVGMRLQNFEYEKYEIDLEDNTLIDLLLSADKKACFIPIVYNASKQFEYVSAVFNLIISGNIRNTGAGTFVSLGNWYSLFPLVNESFTSKILRQTPNNNTCHYYAIKVKKFIESNFHTHISVAEIAANLKITPNYLSTLFRKEYGITIIEYTNRLRAQMARKLMQTRSYTVTEIARRVGLNDTRYLQRLFKKHYGICLRECALIDNEITWFHENPEKNLSTTPTTHLTPSYQQEAAEEKEKTANNSSNTDVKK